MLLPVARARSMLAWIPFGTFPAAWAMSRAKRRIAAGSSPTLQFSAQRPQTVQRPNAAVASASSASSLTSSAPAKRGAIRPSSVW